MLHKHATTVGLVLALLCLASTVVFAQDSDNPPTSTGVVVTITAIDARHHMATLQTEAGEVFELPKDSLWTIGDTVECDRIEGPRPRLQHCQPWAVASPAPRAGQQPSRADVPSTREGEVRFLATPSATPSDECKQLRKSVVRLERDRASAPTGAAYLPSLEAELETARQGVASCEAKGQ